MEIWELASALGANRPDENVDPLRDPDGLSWGERRALAHARGEPEPQWDDVPLTAAEVAQQQRLMAVVPPMLPPGTDTPS